MSSTDSPRAPLALQGDGEISLDELRLAVGALRIPHDDASLRSLFRDIDADDSGFIDSDELYHALRKHGAVPKRGPPKTVQLAMPTRREEAGLSTAERKAIDKLKQGLRANLMRVIDLFRKWDTDGNGCISEVELRRALAGLCLPIDKAAVRRLIQEVDADGSGEVEFEELNAFLRRDEAGHEDESHVRSLGAPIQHTLSQKARSTSHVRAAMRPSSSVPSGIRAAGRRGAGSLPPLSSSRPGTAPAAGVIGGRPMVHSASAPRRLR